MITQYDMASGEPLDDTGMDGETPVETRTMALKTRLESVETAKENERKRWGTMPADLALLDIEAFLRRQR